MRHFGNSHGVVARTADSACRSKQRRTQEAPELCVTLVTATAL